MIDCPIPARYRLDSYRFDLPADRIAQEPAAERAASRMLVLPRRSGPVRHATFRDLPGLLLPGDVLVLNDTRVVPARLFALKPTGGRVELLVLQDEKSRFKAMFGTNRGLRPGTLLEVLDHGGSRTGLRAMVESVGADGSAALEMQGDIDVDGVMTRFGHMPLPPYIRRDDGNHAALDRERYQTIYARSPGAVAAPTAGLHFTPAVLDELRIRGVEVVPVTLHVGPGTFRPVKVEDVRLHDVGEEIYDLPEASAMAINRALAEGRRVIAVGTTVVRTLETAVAGDAVRPGPGSTRLLIFPGHRFRVVSGMVTNFHLPGSSLLLLVSAMAGRMRVLAAYRQAVREGYRFYSYGDAMLVLP
jgi:S-adenosylmethionine:tRNA ribosyltransferase-isomerase